MSWCPTCRGLDNRRDSLGVFDDLEHPPGILCQGCGWVFEAGDYVMTVNNVFTAYAGRWHVPGADMMLRELVREHTRVYGHRLVSRQKVEDRGYAEPRFSVRLNGRLLHPQNLRHLAPDVIEIIGGHEGRVDVYERDTHSVWEPDAGRVLREVCRG